MTYIELFNNKNFDVICDNVIVDETGKALSDKIDDEVNDIYGKVVCTSDVELNGYRNKDEVKKAGKSFPSGNRDGESNTGDFAADAYRAQVIRLIKEGEKYDVDEAHIVSMLNGGSIRAGIQKGDATRKDLLTTFPFFDSVCGVYVKGSGLLEVLEASTFDMPDAQGGRITTRYKDPAGRIQVVNKPDKKANTMTVKTTTKKVSKKKLKKKAIKVKPIKVKKAVGTVRYKKTSGSRRLTVNKKTGVVTVKKKTKKGTYKIKVRVSASGNDSYKSKNKTVTVKVKVR